MNNNTWVFDCCKCKNGTPGPQGPAGPPGPQGPPGPAGESCCCRNSIYYALQTIKTVLQTSTTAHSFNTNASGAIGDFYGVDDAVKIGDRYVSLCNIVYLTFSVAPTSSGSTIFNCTTEECCCNTGLEEVIRSLVGTVYPSTNPIQVEILDNESTPERVITVYGICNGILWGEVSGGGNEPYLAIPLCSIFYVTEKITV